jgi:DNA end-binding protein Ku
MRFANELVDVSDLSFPDAEIVRPQELNMATQLVANLAESFDPKKYTDEYRASLMKIIRAKMKGQKIELEAAESPESTQVLDLMSRLQASLDEAAATKRRKPARAHGSRGEGRHGKRRTA